MPAPVNQKLALIRAKLADVLKTIKTAGGFLTNIVDANVHLKYDKTIADSNKDTDFPKVFIVINAGNSTQLTSNRSEEEIAYSVIVIFKALTATQDPNLMCENLREDVKQAILNNRTLSGLVEYCWMDGFSTDGGYLFPEGAIVFKISCKYYDK